jgi:MFS family permease
MIGNPGSNYKWYILALVTATSFFLAGMARVAIPVLFPEISAELGLSLLQMGAVWGMEPFAAMLVAPLSGLLIDRFGLRLMLPLICLAIGITGALRGLATGFPSLAAAMFASGIFGAMVPTVGSKAVALWFDRRHLGLANSISIMGVTIGLMAGAVAAAGRLAECPVRAGGAGGPVRGLVVYRHPGTGRDYGAGE